MQNEIKKLRIPWLSSACLIVLIALVPCAISFKPCSPHSPEASNPSRAALILLGLVATNLAFAELCVACFWRRTDLNALAPFAAAALACAVVGWRSYPYWINGVYQVAIGTFPPMDQDPKGLIPMLWIGEFWRLPVMLICGLYYPAILILGLDVLIALFRRRFIVCGMTAIFVGITIVFMRGFSPNYMSWLMD